MVMVVRRGDVSNDSPETVLAIKRVLCVRYEAGVEALARRLGAGACRGGGNAAA